MIAPCDDTATPRAGIVEHNLPRELPHGEVRCLWFEIENRGVETWQPGEIQVAIAIDGARQAVLDLPRAVDAGTRLALSWIFRTPAAPGEHGIELSLLDTRLSSATRELSLLRIALKTVTTAPTATSALRDRVLDHHARGWLVADGVTSSAAGPDYPQFARSARGCRLVDLEGREFVDYLMGWGSALLGYAPARIQAAITNALASAGTLTLTPHLLPEVAERLVARFPGAEAVTFGKNGSDVCTAAVRLARVVTGRSVVLTCGYHGWQDWSVEKYGFAATGVPARERPLVIPFRPNDRDQIAQLFAAHHGEVAAVMLEPAGVIEGASGPIQSADAGFLHDLRALAHREGALMIFDEIFTGFRHLGGSVQQAIGLEPDLTCLGKALSGGMPLSALVGKKAIFDAGIGRIFYEPTYKTEAYALAAALEALRFYDEVDVPAQVAEFGDRLRRLVLDLGNRMGIAVEMIGPPYRQMLVIREEDVERRNLARTLLHQELLRRGVLSTQNLFLPSIAHDEQAFQTTRDALEQALVVVGEAMKEDQFISRLEIPRLPG